MKYKFWLFFLLYCCQYSIAQKKNVLIEILEEYPHFFSSILSNPAKYEIQIIYTQIDRDRQNQPFFRSYTYHADSTAYFYPASTVKMALSFLALERINHLRRVIPSLDKDTHYVLDSVRPRQIPFFENPQAIDKKPSLAQDIKEIMLVSDNFAYNHLFDFLGRDYINQKLEEKGYKNSRILHRFNIPAIDNRFTAPMTFFDAKGSKILQLGEQVSIRSYQNQQKGLLKGVGYLDAKDSLVKAPFDFSTKNYFSLFDQQKMLRAVLFPETVATQNRFDLTEDDYRFLWKYMSMLPRKSSYPSYPDSVEYYDGYCKFLMWGDGKEKRPEHIRIFNKVGDAYGYLIDNAYIIDTKNNIEFLLSAVILCNEDLIFNDGNYEYEAIGLPFLGNLGRVIYDYELKRKRKYQPNLSKFNY
jgi:hypothetical protein